MDQSRCCQTCAQRGTEAQDNSEKGCNYVSRYLISSFLSYTQRVSCRSAGKHGTCPACDGDETNNIRYIHSGCIQQTSAPYHKCVTDP